MRLEYKPQFFDDLDDIKEYITQNFDSELAREKVRQIYDSCAVLLENPK
jgi:plasmid stabilization system protein ParE